MGIGQLNEKNIHRQLKEYFMADGIHGVPLLEHKLFGYIVDVCNRYEDRTELIEIQTKNLSAIAPKLVRLSEKIAGSEEDTLYKLTLVYPVFTELYIITSDEGGNRLRKRKSPKKGSVYTAFKELCRASALFFAESLSVEILLVTGEEFRINDGKGSYSRRGASVCERRITDIVGGERFDCKEDFLRLLPFQRDEAFTVRDTAERLRIGENEARQLLYTLCKATLLSSTEKRGRQKLYVFADCAKSVVI